MTESESRNLLPGKLRVAVKKAAGIPTKRASRVEQKAKTRVLMATFTTVGEKMRDKTGGDASPGTLPPTVTGHPGSRGSREKIKGRMKVASRHKRRMPEQAVAPTSSHDTRLLPRLPFSGAFTSCFPFQPLLLGQQGHHGIHSGSQRPVVHDQGPASLWSRLIGGRQLNLRVHGIHPLGQGQHLLGLP